MDVPHYVIPAEAGIQINFFVFSLCSMLYALCQFQEFRNRPISLVCQVVEAWV